MKLILSTKADYEQVLLAIKEVIHSWDPYALLSGGAPEDEFDGEIGKLATKLREIKSEKDIANSLRQVFESSFELNASDDEYLKIGEKLFLNLKKHNVLTNE